MEKRSSQASSWLGLALIAGVFLIYFRAQFAFIIYNPSKDDGCYVDWLTSLMKFFGLLSPGEAPRNFCHSTAYPPGISLLWFPSGLVAWVTARLSGAPFATLLPCFIGLAAYGYWIGTFYLLYRVYRTTSDSAPLLRAFALLLSTPVLYYCTYRTTMVHGPEVFLATLSVILLVRSNTLFKSQDSTRATKVLGIASALALLLGLTKINDLAIVFVFLGAAVDSLKNFPTKKAQGALGVSILALVVGSAWAGKVLLFDGYNGTLLPDLIKQLSIERLRHVVFGWDAGVFWFSPIWIAALLAGGIFIRSLSWAARGAWLWMVLELLVSCGWVGNGADFGYRYLLGSFAGAWLIGWELRTQVTWVRKLEFPLAFVGAASLSLLTWLYKMSMETTPYLSVPIEGGLEVAHPRLIPNMVDQLLFGQRMFDPIRYSPIGNLYFTHYFPGHKYGFAPGPQSPVQTAVLCLSALGAAVALALALYMLVRPKLKV